ncbi:MAG: hypothetical protein ACOCTQ_02730 [Planctomycetota bacterium]
MPAEVPLEELERVNEELESLKMKAPEVHEDFVNLFKRNRSVGYKNICKMLMGEATPRELKGLD